VRQFGYLLELYRDAWSPEYKTTRIQVQSAANIPALSINRQHNLHVNVYRYIVYFMHVRYVKI
jgi:hypothetical protein